MMNRLRNQGVNMPSVRVLMENAVLRDFAAILDKENEPVAKNDEDEESSEAIDRRWTVCMALPMMLLLAPCGP